MKQHGFLADLGLAEELHPESKAQDLLARHVAARCPKSLPRFGGGVTVMLCRRVVRRSSSPGADEEPEDDSGSSSSRLLHSLAAHLSHSWIDLWQLHLAGCPAGCPVGCVLAAGGCCCLAAASYCCWVKLAMEKGSQWRGCRCTVQAAGCLWNWNDPCSSNSWTLEAEVTYT